MRVTDRLIPKYLAGVFPTATELQARRMAPARQESGRTTPAVASRYHGTKEPWPLSRRSASRQSQRCRIPATRFWKLGDVFSFGPLWRLRNRIRNVAPPYLEEGTLAIEIWT